MKLAIPADIKIEITEIQNAEKSARVVGMMVAEGLEKRLPFRRVLKSTIEKVMQNKDVMGIKISIGGRLGGADMARTEFLKKGNIPLQTLRADVDFAREKAHMTYGVLGIKVWIYKGQIFSKKKSINK
jgi:small subunit ribosomal protein S3